MLKYFFGIIAGMNIKCWTKILLYIKALSNDIGIHFMSASLELLSSTECPRKLRSEPQKTEAGR